MVHQHTMTAQATRQYEALSEELRERTDKVILGVSLVPTVGVYDPPTNTFAANVGDDLRITYRIDSGPDPQVIILQVRPPTHRVPELPRLDTLAGITR